MDDFVLPAGLWYHLLKYSIMEEDQGERNHKFGFEIVELENIQDAEVEMPHKRLKIKGLCQRYKFENHCI